MKKSYSNIKELCNIYTDLSSSDIEELYKIADIMPIFAELIGADVFIDCLTGDKNKAIVVAEAKPISENSNYDYSVVGQKALLENEPAALRTLNTGLPTRNLKAITQENKTVIQNTMPINNQLGAVIGVLIIEQDIKKHYMSTGQVTKMCQDLIGENKELFTYIEQNLHTLTQQLNESIILFNKQGISTYASSNARILYQKLGYRDDIIGMKFDNLALDGMTFRDVFDKQHHNIGEVNIGGLDLEIKYVLMKQRNKVVGINMLIQDVTEVKEKEKELILKSVAIQEIHHRVKNNLQTIASLLRLQSRRVKDEYVKKSLNDSINRIISMSVTHELLAQKGIDEVDIKTILEKIGANAINYTSIPSQSIYIKIEGDSIFVDSNDATAIALVVNELLQNSIEHGFENRRIGHITIGIDKGDPYSTISVMDDGKGYYLEDIEVKNLGLQIVERIVKDQLEGDISVRTSRNGTTTTFDFKI